MLSYWTGNRIILLRSPDNFDVHGQTLVLVSKWGHCFMVTCSSSGIDRRKKPRPTLSNLYQQYDLMNIIQLGLINFFFEQLLSLSIAIENVNYYYLQVRYGFFLGRIRISIFLKVRIRIRHPGLGTYKKRSCRLCPWKKRPVAAARSQCQTGRPSQDLTIPSHGTVY